MTFTEEEISKTNELLKEALIQDEINNEISYKNFSEEMINNANCFINELLNENIETPDSLNEIDENKEKEDEIDDCFPLKDKNEKSKKIENKQKINNSNKHKNNNISTQEYVDISDEKNNIKNIISNKIKNREDLDLDDMNNDITTEKEYNSNKIINSIIYNNKLFDDFKEYIIYDNKVFKLNSKQSKYYRDKGKNIDIFKCKNSRKNERERKAAKLGEFCSAKIKKETLDNNNKFIYEFINNHSDACLNIKHENNKNEEKPVKELLSFKEKCFEILNNFNEYNRTEMKKAMAEKYNLENYDFTLKENMLNNIINEWKKYSNKFNKFTIFENQGNLDDKQFLKKYTYQYIETERS